MRLPFLLSFLLALASVVTAQIEISTLADLDNVRNDLTADYVLVSDIDASATADPGYNGGEGWLPIGRVGASGMPFTGTFDGQGFTITGLTINRPAASGTGSLVALFARLGEGSIVSNLHLEEVDIIGNNLVGGIAGRIDNSVIINCSVSGQVRGREVVGGLVGTQGDATIEGCWTTGEVEQDGAPGPVGAFGGLVGSAGGSILRSYSTSDVVGDTAVGGLAGRMSLEATLEECFATGDVGGTDSIVGSLVGEQNGPVSRCYATGNATGLTVAGAAVGGLVGRQNENVAIADSFARGSAAGLQSIGGAMGLSIGGGEIARCFSTGVVTGDGNLGGLLGVSQFAVVTASYWDTDTSGMATSAGGAGAIGRTTAEMTTPFAANAFVGWNFDDVWLEQAEVNDGYPVHQWQTVRHTLLYTAGVGGSVQGDMEQVRIPGVSGSPVTAVPDSYQYAFLEWSDGSTENPRTDLKVMSDLSVTANFYETNLIGIWTLADLDNVRNDLTGDYVLLNDIDASETADPGYNGGEGWLPLGRVGGSVASFSGSFDGQGFTISGLTLNRPLSATSSGTNAGLFGVLHIQAAVSNLHLVDVDFVGYSQVGGIAGTMRGSSTVTGCSVSGVVRGEIRVGGLVGIQEGGTIENCWTEGEVETFGVNTNRYAGGLVGHCDAIIRGSYSTCEVSGGDWVGGLTGIVAGGGMVEECFAAGDASGTSSLIGSLSGAQSGIIARCYATGSAVGVEGNFGSVGGLVGRQDAGADLQDSFARGDAKGSTRIGGLLGWQRDGGMMSRCFSTGIPTGNTAAVGGILGAQNVGTVTVSYWDTDSSGIATSAGGAEAFGRTTTDMTTPFGVGAYTSWDFVAVWLDEDEANDGYPIHQWQTVRHTLQYAAGSGGSLDGDLAQGRIPGLSGTAVTALPNDGFEFLKWSDGSTENPRRDLKVTSAVNVTAIFTDPNAVTSGWMIY